MDATIPHYDDAVWDGKFVVVRRESVFVAVDDVHSVSCIND
jgi:hypothetical protein